MVYDAARQQVVLYGGRTPSEVLFDTWVWDGNAWTQKFPAATPTAGQGYIGVYDVARAEVLIHGGAVPSIRLSETWAWNGANWTSKSSNGPVGVYLALAYDAPGQQVLSFGGGVFSGATFVPVTDTRSWNGSTWTFLQPSTSPPASTQYAMAGDEARGEVVLFQPNQHIGAGTAGTPQTWVWGSAVGAGAFSDDFNDNFIDPLSWSVEGPPATGIAATVSEINQRLEITMGAGLGGGGVVSVCSVTGDFDAQVDYLLLNWPADNRHTLQMRALDVGTASFGPPGPFRHSGPQELYGTVLADRVEVVPTTDTAGKLRLMRAGSTLSGFFHNGSQWVLIGSSGISTDQTRIALEFGSGSDPNSPADVHVAFDNFLAGAESLDCPQFSPPQITSVSPTSGFVGTAVTITGMRFASAQGASSVQFDSLPALILSWSANSIEVAVPPVTPGSYHVTVTVGDQTSNVVPYQVHSTPISTNGTPGTSTNPSGSFAEPVNTATGNYYTSQTDIMVPGRGFPFVFTRYYNSQDSYNGPLGVGWTHSHNVLLAENVVTGDVILKDADGHGVIFSPVGGGGYTPSTPGVHDQLQKNPDGTFTLTRKNQTALHFSGLGKLLSITDRNGNAQTLSYDGAGNLTAVIDPAGRSFTFGLDSGGRIATLTDPGGGVLTYSYDGDGNLVSYENSAGGITEYTYDPAHGMVSMVDPLSRTVFMNTYDGLGRVISQENARGFNTAFEYHTPALAVTTITDARGNETKHTHDSNLRLVSVEDALGGAILYSYDASNNRTAVTNQNGHTTTFSYDSRGNITGITDALGNLALFTYDGNHNLLSATNAKGFTTSFTYDGSGNLKTIVDALGNNTEFAYHPFGQLTSKKDARGNTTTYQYDVVGNLAESTDPLGNETVLSYDTLSRLSSITDPNGNTATATYDALSRLVSIADPLENETRFDYDLVGNLLKTTDANGNATAYGYDATNNLVGVTDALGRVTIYTYDPNNNRTGFINAKGNTTTYAYDVLNRLAAVTDPHLFVTSYSYDSVGNVIAVNDPSDNTNEFTYDALNRLVGIAYGDGKTVIYTYDVNGNRTEMADSTGTTTYIYDDLDRLILVRHPGNKTVAYAYDAVGNRQSIIYPDGKTVTYAHDQTNRLSKATDWQNRRTDYTYDPAGNLIDISYPTKAGMSFSYDVANRLVQVANRYRGSNDPEANPISSFTYVLDAVGNRLQVTDGSAKSTQYGYDALYQLSSVNVNGKITQYAYDAVGNRLSLNAPGSTITYAYDAADRLLSAGPTTFTYDANGNQITKTASGTTLAYQYDAASRLLAVTGGGASSSFTYDGDGNRVSQSVGAGTYTYLNDVTTTLPVVLQESGPDGPISYTYGLGLISAVGSNFDYLYHYDGLGSIVGLTNLRGRLLNRYVYDAWGETVLNVADPVIGTRNKFRFTGEALDQGTDLYYLRARYYDPKIGRFITKDPAPGHSLTPLTLGRFTYALNNPVLLTDKTGLDSFKPTTLASTFSTSVAASGPGVRQGFDKLLTEVGRFLSGLLPIDIWGAAEKLEVHTQTEAARLQWYRQNISHIIEDVAWLLDSGSAGSTDEAINIATRLVPTVVDFIEVERLRIFFAGYQEGKITVPQIKAYFLGSEVSP